MPSETVGFIGLGIMGRPMALNLIKAGYKLVVTSRSKGPIDALSAAGAKAVKTPADVAREADVIVTMVPDTPDVELVIRGKDGADGVLGGLKRGAIVIDMSTISPDVTRQLAEAVAAKGGSMLDAPVSGGEIGAKNATLTIMVGGDEKVFERVKPLFERMGKNITLVGANGDGQ